MEFALRFWTRKLKVFITKKANLMTTELLPENQIETIKLGDIKAAIAPLSIDEDGLTQLGFTPVAKEKASKLYRKSDLPKMCDAIIAQVSKLRQTLID